MRLDQEWVKRVTTSPDEELPVMGAGCHETTSKYAVDRKRIRRYSTQEDPETCSVAVRATIKDEAPR